MQTLYDIVIVGAGPAGMTAACYIAFMLLYYKYIFNNVFDCYTGLSDLPGT